jgi:fibro-slime domain-containing protein
VSEFVYLPGQFFSFYGDDDVWVFVNDKLVLDLGGTHRSLGGSVSLDEVASQQGFFQISLFSKTFITLCCQALWLVRSTSYVCFTPKDIVVNHRFASRHRSVSTRWIVVCLFVCDCRKCFFYCRCPGGPCRLSEPTCDSFDTDCQSFDCVAGEPKSLMKNNNNTSQIFDKKAHDDANEQHWHQTTYRSAATHVRLSVARVRPTTTAVPTTRAMPAARALLAQTYARLA